MTLKSHHQTVLIVDDEITNIKVLSSLLSDELKIIFATNGSAALKLVHNRKPDLVLLDIMMPDIDGYEVCRQLKADPETEDVPVIFVTAKDQEQDEAEGFETGAIDFITKPFRPHIVKARVRNHLELIGQRNTLKQLSEELEAYRKRVNHELQMARETQEFLLPGLATLNSIQKTHQLEVTSHFRTCSELGGDYWGIKALDSDRVAVLIADFSGHGVNAALNTFRLHALLDETLEGATDPAVFLEKLNTRLSPLLPTGQYATAFCGVIHKTDQRIYYSAAASPSPLVLLPGKLEPIVGNGEGFPLGMFDKSSYNNRTLPFPPSSTLILYSDAVTETRLIDGGRLMETGLIELITNYLIPLPRKQRLDTLIKKLNELFISPITDDMTVINVNRDD